MTTFGNTDYIPTNVPDIEAVAVTSSASVTTSAQNQAPRSTQAEPSPLVSANRHIV